MSQGSLEDLCRAEWIGSRAECRRLAEFLRLHARLIVEAWGRSYREVFGEAASLGARAFEALHREELTHLVRSLTDDQSDLFGWGIAWGARLKARRVPYEEVVVSLHLFEEACCAVGGAEALALRETLDRLGHVRIALLALGYFEAVGREEIVREAQAAGRPPSTPVFCGMVGASPAMQEVFQLILIAATSNASVLLVGESGTGKELAARAIHRLSESPVDRFVPVNCAALPAELVESELFGHRRGAFSGAGDDKEGLFQAADGGTLFLDEITELPVTAQAKLLRPLQEGRVRRVGDTEEREVEVRVIASTNLPLEEVRDGGRLRRDLFYRLHGFVISLPPLRERLVDVPLLVEHFLARRARRPVRVSQRFSPEAMAALCAYTWPGNVRELQAVVERAALLCPQGRIECEHLPAEVVTPQAPAVPVPEGQEADVVPIRLKDAERQSIARALEIAAGNKSMAARMLGISRKQLYVKIARYGLG